MATILGSRGLQEAQGRLMQQTKALAGACEPVLRGRCRDDVHLALNGEFQGLEIGNELYGGPNQVGVGERDVARDLTCQASIQCVVARSES